MTASATLRFYVVLSLTLLTCACRPQPVVTTVPGVDTTTNTPLQRGIRYLLDQQSEDGAWRSNVYGHFRAGDCLTPLVVVTLQQCPPTPQNLVAIQQGRSWLQKAIQMDGTIDPAFPLNYPVYTASLTSQALTYPDATSAEKMARSVWLKMLRDWQMTEENGWQKIDWQYGGWGYAGVIPHKPENGPVPEALEANLSATAYALEALHAAEVPSSDPLWAKARIFVERCQNFAAVDPQTADDGGFFFVPNDPQRNKAGLLEENNGKVRFRSYGSATVDGMRCLNALGIPPDDPRQQAASKWLRTQHRVGHPGKYALDRQNDQDGPFFYYAAGLSKLPEVSLLQTVQEELVKRQHADGSWANPHTQVREDDPLLATALAIAALSNVRPE